MYLNGAAKLELCNLCSAFHTTPPSQPLYVSQLKCHINIYYAQRSSINTLRLTRHITGSAPPLVRHQTARAGQLINRARAVQRVWIGDPGAANFLLYSFSLFLECHRIGPDIMGGSLCLCQESSPVFTFIAPTS